MSEVLRATGYYGLEWSDFSEWRDMVLADPEKFRSWSFCASLTVEGDGMDSMVDNSLGARAMRESVGAIAFDGFSPRSCLEGMLRFCNASGLLPAPQDTQGGVTRESNGELAGSELARPLLSSAAAV